MRRGARVAGLVLLVGTAGAQPQTPARFPLLVSAPSQPGCPSQEAIEQALRARDLSFRPPAPGEAATELRMETRSAGVNVQGTLELRLLSGELVRRELQGASCDEVVRSLTLVAALALAPLYAPPPALSSAPVVSSAPPAASSSPPVSAPPPPTPPRPSPPPPASRSPWKAGLEVGAMSGLGPRVSPGIGPWIQRDLGRISLRLGAGYWPHGSTSAGPSRAEFSAALLDLNGCVRWPLARELDGAACAGVHGGYLRAKGEQIDEPRAETRAWLAPRLGGRLSWAPETGGLVELNLGLFSPIFRDSFVFETPRVEIHQPPLLGFLGSVGGGFAFP